jgi:ABC-type molybdate transport system permease subunit
MTTRRLQLATALLAAIALILLILSPRAPGLACLAALIPGLILGLVLWSRARWLRALAAAALVGLTFGPALLAATPLIALPAYAALRRLSPERLDEFRVGGASLTRAFLVLILPIAMPGLAAGAVLSLLPGGPWRYLGVALALI